jgi:hypothetical protein
MTLSSIHEYADAKRGHYLKASKDEKGKILDEFISVTGCHRKAAIRLLRHNPKREINRKRGRPQEYGIEVITALKTVWEASDHLCSKRLQPFIPELIAVLERKGEIKVSAEVRNQLVKLSASTIDRLLLPYRKLEGRRPLSTTKPGSLLKSAIPIRTFADWEDSRPGFWKQTW